MQNKYEADTRVSEYVLEECIGTGAFSKVWRARHHIWDSERVAIKLPIEPEYVRYLRREGVVVHGLRHPNIVRVLGLDPYAEMPYLVMELVHGPALRAVIDQHPKGIKVETATVILRGVLDAMVAAHGANILHRDLKPGNVLLDLAGDELENLNVNQVKVTDFGLGVANEDALRSIAQSASMDREDKLVGTLAYMAPELRDGRQQADQRSDLYSIGVLFFEMLTGERPAGAELPGTLRADVPEALDEVFRRLYSHRDRRYESAAAVVADLNTRLRPAAANGAPPVPGSIPSTPPLPRERKRASKRCKNCGGACQASDQFCTHCGHQMAAAVRRCSACGAYPGPDDRFCIFCGARMSAEG